MLVSLSELLRDAEEKKYAVGLFNMLNLEMARGIIDAAEAERSPVILGVAEVHLPVVPFCYASLIMNQIARDASVPVCLHFDHGTDYAKILEAIRAGFSSVMYDGSALPYEENIRNTAEISKVAHALGVDVEAELGHVGGAEDGQEDGAEACYTEVSQICDFLDRSGTDALAVAIGTAHGKYVKTPVLDIRRLSKIYQVSGKPLVLHGGSGLSDQDFRNTILNGIRKVNICTEMCIAAKEAYVGAYPNFEAASVAAKQAVQKVVAGKMRLFGSSGKA